MHPSARPDPVPAFGVIYDPDDGDMGITATADGVTAVVWLSNHNGPRVSVASMYAAASAALDHRVRQLRSIPRGKEQARCC